MPEPIIDLDGGPRIPKMYRLAVEYLAESQGVPMNHIYQDALDALLADFDWTQKELRDYYGKRAVALDGHMRTMKKRGIATRDNVRQAA